MDSSNQVRSAFGFIALFSFLLSLLAAAYPAHANTGTDWLVAQSQPDGSYALPGDTAYPFQSTAEGLRTLHLYGQSGDASTVAAREFMRVDGYDSTEHLARKILISTSYGGDASAQLLALRSMLGTAGGFGELTGYGASPIDTAFALEAFTASGYLGAETGTAVQYLLDTQAADGGWQAGANTTSVYVTALAVHALVPFRERYAGVSTALARAETFLLSQRHADGTWGGDLDTIQVLIALIPEVADAAVLQASIAALQAAQAADGSWGGDVYVTALALRALAYYDTRTTAPADPASAAITGRVVNAGSNAPLAGATAEISELPGVRVSSGTDGGFGFASLPPGHYTVVVSKSGYDTLSAAVDVLAGQIHQLGTVALNVSSTQGVISGTVMDTTAGGTLANVTVTLGTPEPLQTTTDGAGRYELTSVPPGTYTITFSKAGFSTVTGQLSVDAGQITAVNLPLAPEGTYDDRPGDISATVIDGETGQPLAGALFELGNGSSAVSDGTGHLLISSVPRGTYQATLGAEGYQGVSLTLLFTPGASGDLGTLSLYPAVPQTAPTTLTINGTVIDATFATPVAGATVTDIDSGTTVVCDAAGHFILEGLASTTVKASLSAPGYNPASYTLTAAGFGSTQVTLPLTSAGTPPPSDPTLFSAAGSVVDADSGMPLSGVSVKVVGATVSTGTTGADGRFVLSNLPESQVFLTFSYPGYISRDLQADLAPMTLTDLGQIALRPTAAALPDLMVHSTDTAGATTDPRSLTYSGTVTVTLGNIGTADATGPVGVVAFYDNDGDGLYSQRVDAYLGESSTGATLGVGAEATIAIEVFGGLPFRDAPIRVAVDWNSTVEERNEGNNVLTSASLCAVTPSHGNVLTDPNDARSWLGATVGSFATLIYGADTVENRRKLIDRQMLVDGIFDPTGARPAKLLSAGGSGGCLGTSYGGGGFGYSCGYGGDVSPYANAIDNLWFQTSGTVGQTVFDLGFDAAKVAVFNSIDHGPLPGEAIESTVYLSNDRVNWRQAVTERVWLQGYLTNEVYEGFVYTVGTGTGDTFRYVSVIHGGPDAFVRDGDNEINGLLGLNADLSQSAADLTASLLSVTTASGAHPSLRVRIGNAGSGESPTGIDVAFYDGNPQSGGTFLGSATLPALPPDDYLDIVFEATSGLSGTREVYAIVDFQARVSECDETNNIVSVAAPSLHPDLVVSAVDRAGAVTDPTTFSTTGHVTATVANKGSLDASGSVALLAFFDADSDGTYGEGIDVVLGRATLAGGVPVGAQADIDIALQGDLPFRDAGIWVWVDSQQAIEEESEVNNLGATSLACRMEPQPPSQLQLVTQWHWNEPTARAGANLVYGPVMVGQLSDDNSDGSIDNTDVPDLVFMSVGAETVLNVVSGRDGTEIWSRRVDVAVYGSAALADIDEDGIVEIIVSNKARTALNVFEHDGALKWSAPLGPKHGDISRDGIAVADLDKNGSPEIVIGRRAYSSSGTLLWEGTKDYGGEVGYGMLSIVADIDMSGSMEVVAGRTAYNADGSVKWHNTQIPYDGFNALGNFDDDAYPEIVLVSQGRIYLLEHTGALKWGPLSIPGGGVGGAPTVADFDGDGAPEIGVAGASNYVVVETNGTLKWATRTQDFSSNRTGSSVFDFEGDGKAEVLYADEINFYVYDGRTGATRATLKNGSGTTLEYPTVADVDNDGEAEVIVAGNTGAAADAVGVRVLQSGFGHWLNTRQIWNQHSYHITNINDDGTIPAEEKHSWLTHNTYRLNTFLDRDPLSTPDLNVGRLAVADSGAGGMLLSARVGNGGLVTSPGDVRLSFYAGNPDQGGRLLATTLLPPVNANAYRDVSVPLQGVYDGTEDLYAFVDADERVAECNELNNRAYVPGNSGSTQLGSITVATDSAVYGPNTPVMLYGTVFNGGSLVGDYTAQLRLEDSKGQVVATYAVHSVSDLQPGNQGTVADSWNSGLYLAGVYRLSGTLSNSAGVMLDEAVATFEIRHDANSGLALSLRTTTDKPVYSTTDTVNIENLLSNLTQSTLVEAGTLRLTITDPAGRSIYQVNLPVAQLSPGAQTQLPASYRFAAVAGGNYTVTASVLDQAGAVLAEASAAYEVREDLLRTLTGTVAVSYPELYRGESQICTDTIQNRGTLDLAAQPIRQIVGAVAADAAAVDTQSQIALAAGGVQTLVHSFPTRGFALGDYACVLQTRIDGAWQTLGFATFRVLPPPIRIDASATQGTRGRLLVLLDDGATGAGGDGGDPHGPGTAPDFYDQWAFLEETLTAAGWSYTVVSDAESFTRELRSGGYAVYLLLAEQAKLPNQVQKELREAVFRGEGLVVAGDHDQRNALLDDALGLKYVGKANAAGLVGWGDPLSEAAQSALAVSPKVERVTVNGALVAGTFSTGEPAITVNGFGEGKAIYAAFDLLAETTADAGAGQLDELLLDALDHVHPETLTPVAGGVLPFHLSLRNEGIATPGRITLVLPAGVQVVDPGTAQFGEGILMWSFDLAEDGVAEFDAWLRLPAATGPLTLTARLETGTPDAFEPYDQVTLTLVVAEAPATTEPQDLLAADPAAAKDKTLGQAGRLLDAALAAKDEGRAEEALRGMVEACDVLTEGRYDPLHKAIADALWTLGREWRP